MQLPFGRKAATADPAGATSVAQRIPPGQSLTRDFPVLHYGPVPLIDLKRWNFRVFGLVEQPMEWNWEQYGQLPRKSVTLDIHCVTRWSKLDTAWEGADAQQLLALVKPMPRAKFVVAECEYGFTTSVPLEVFDDEQTLIADTYDGQPLERKHGWPARLLIPGKYFWKSAKWLRALKFTEHDELGFWERHGYHNNADPWAEERFSDD
jgi:DMSO/TMAO reductase YedYZ molybdopterin-dependent catalytic subunit